MHTSFTESDLENEPCLNLGLLKANRVYRCDFSGMNRHARSTTYLLPVNGSGFDNFCLCCTVTTDAEMDIRCYAQHITVAQVCAVRVYFFLS